MIAIPVDQLSPDLLDAVIESFVLREGTDYGGGDFTLVQKRQQVRAALQRGDVTLCFDADSESVTIVPTHELPPAARLPRGPAGGAR